jgi:hypothetical protein
MHGLYCCRQQVVGFAIFSMRGCARSVKPVGCESLQPFIAKDVMALAAQLLQYPLLL